MGKYFDKSLRRAHIVSYDLVSKVPPQSLQRVQFIIADDLPYRKSSSTQQTKTVVPIVKHTLRAPLLSGTEAFSQRVELSARVDDVCSNLFTPYNEYVHRHCNARTNFWGLRLAASSNQDELHTVTPGTIFMQ